MTLYDQLIEHAQGSPRPQETSEEHHIVPRCMGGSDDDSNKVYLSTHEHIWAHIWLAEMYPDVFGLQLAVSFMVFGDNEHLGRFPTEGQVRGSVESRERARKLNSEVNRGRQGPWLGKSLSGEHRRKMSEAHQGSNRGEKNPMHGTLPWLNPATLRSPKSLQVWFHADGYFKLWKDHRCGHKKLAKLFGVSVSRTHWNLIVKFRDGWDPNKDMEWLTFKENFDDAI